MDRGSRRNKLILSLLLMVIVIDTMNSTPYWGLFTVPIPFVLPLLIERDIHKNRKLTIMNILVSVPLHAWDVLLGMGYLLTVFLIIGIISTGGIRLIDIHYMVQQGDAENVASILESGTDPNQRNKYGETFLHAVLGYENEDAKEKASLLLDKGADANAKDNDGNTPLHDAVGTVNDDAKEIVSLLLDKGADANAKNNDGNTPLHVAAVDGSAESAALLIGRGADIHIENRSGGSFLSELKKRIQEDPNFRNSKGYKELIKTLPGFGARKPPP